MIQPFRSLRHLLPAMLALASAGLSWGEIRRTGSDSENIGVGWEITVAGSPEHFGESDEDGANMAVGESGAGTVRLRAEILRFEKDLIRIRPAVFNGEEIEISLASIIGIHRLAADGTARIPAGETEDSPEKPPHPGFRVTLREGGEFTGRLASYEGEVIGFESDRYGDLQIPTSAVLAISRDGGRILAPQGEETGEGVRVAVETGEVFRGAIRSDPKDGGTVLLVSGPQANARVPLFLLGRIDFSGENGLGNDGGSIHNHLEINLSDGGHFICREIELIGGHFRASTVSGVSLSIPNKQVTSIYPIFTDKSRGGSRILVWGGYSDLEDTYSATRRSAARSGMAIDEMVGQIPGEDFGERLGKARVFLIPRMSKLKADSYNGTVEFEGKKVALREYLKVGMAPVLKEFLEGGGHVVMTGCHATDIEFLNLIGAEGVGVIGGGGRTRVVPHTISGDAKRWFRLDLDTLDPAKNTSIYQAAAPWVVVAGGSRGAAAITKPVGRGRFTILGLDFVQTNRSLDTLFRQVLRAR